ncbi:MAG: hypothetical protein Q7R70_01745 [Candidatus Diapherotrites archaeon]|nr:hypothetical protein [Candidatus Diapherotrites archaeon]
MASDLIGSTATALSDAALSLWNSFVNVIPGLIAAVIVFLVGYIIGEVVKKIISTLLEKAMVDKWIEERKLESAIGKVKMSKLAGALVKWFIIALFLAQALQLIQLTVLADFAGLLVMYIPKVAGAILFIVLGLLFARYLGNKVLATDYQFKKSIQLIVEIIVAYIAVVIGLQTIGFEVAIMMDAFRIAFTAFVIVAAIVFGINFAMSYKKEIQDFARSFKR